MIIKEFNEEVIRYIASTKDDDVTTQLSIFEGLCTKAKEIIWGVISHDHNYLYCGALYDFARLTPIEQIFMAVSSAYEYFTNNSLCFRFYPQHRIDINGRIYIADFCCEHFIFEAQEYNLSKKIIIECDGYESHHTKEQRNRDIYRENDIKLNGYSVIRFTGSQIYKNPFDCLAKALCFIVEENKQCINKTLKEAASNNGKI